jgi:hypothetical protein
MAHPEITCKTQDSRPGGHVVKRFAQDIAQDLRRARKEIWKPCCPRIDFRAHCADLGDQPLQLGAIEIGANLV